MQYNFFVEDFAVAAFTDQLMDLLLLTAANFRLIFLKKMKFWNNSLNFYYFGDKIRSRRHLPHLLKLANLFLKNVSKFRKNNHF